MRVVPKRGVAFVDGQGRKAKAKTRERRRRRRRQPTKRRRQTFSLLSFQLTGRSAGRDTRPGRRGDARARQARRRGEGRLHSGASRARAGGKGGRENSLPAKNSVVEERGENSEENEFFFPVFLPVSAATTPRRSPRRFLPRTHAALTAEHVFLFP